MGARSVGRVLPLALLAGLLSTAPAVAEDPTPAGLGATDRGKVVQFWQDGGPAVKAAAEAALIASGQDAIGTFLSSGRATAQEQDDREAALQIVAQGGRALREAAQHALAGNAQDLDAFLKAGWQKPFEEDQLVEATRIGDGPGAGRGLKEAANAALNGSVDRVQEFLNHDQYELRDQDDLVRVTQLESTGGVATKRAAASALNSSMDDVREFLLVGQFVSRSHDQEYASIEQIVEQARVAGEQAEREAAAAKDASDRAIAAAQLAKEAAERAAAELRAAQSDAARAIEASRRAAEATRRAADAAASAVSAARKAAAAARLANVTATNAASAAADASEATSKALKAAAAGTVDAATIHQAEYYAQMSSTTGDWANRATNAAAAVEKVAGALKDLTGTLNAALAAADEAGTLAERSGASAAETKAAAASARRYAAEASRASGVASKLASDAGKAAAQARDAARSASGHASAAAQAAREATSHAGDAAQATEQARIHSEAAKAAANAATAAAQQAVDIEQAARKADDEEIAARTIAGRNHAEDLSAAYQQAQAETNRVQAEAQKLDQDAVALAARAAQPGADLGQVVADGRRMAVATMKVGRPWSSAAAAYALAGSDNAMANYARTGWQNARSSDERKQVHEILLTTPYDAVRTAAKTAYAGDATQVHAFLETGQHLAAFTDYQVEASRIAQYGGPDVKQAAAAALNAGTPKALVSFLTTDQYAARETDDRVLAAQLAQNGGAEVKAAAEAALVSPPGILRTFIESGQFQAQRQDQLIAAHLAQVSQALAEAADVAAKARQSASEALRVYALARNATEESAGYAAQAQADAADATKAAKQARDAADKAEASAKKAAEYAKAANQARQRATKSANEAADSAIWAQSSAAAAATSAAKAYAVAAAAQIVAEQAGKDAKSVNDIFQNALTQAKAEQFRTQYGPGWNPMMLSALPPYMRSVIAFNNLPIDQKLKIAIELAHLELDLLSSLPIVGVPAGLANCVSYGLEGLTGETDKYTDAALSCATTVPIAGWGALGVKLEKWGVRASKISEALQGLWRKLDDLPPCLTKPKNSFPAGTRVLMGDGTTSRPIEELHVGDSVLSTDPVTGETGPRNVDATILTPDDREFTTLKIDGSGGTANYLTATSHHPFWSEIRHQWIDAEDLVTGDTLRTSSGSTVPVAEARNWNARKPAFNLTVDELHTYYVLAGSIPVLVHNADCWTVSDEILDDIFDDHGPEILQGVEWNVARYNEGATNHAVNGIGTDPKKLAEYLSLPWKFGYRDTETNNLVHYDEARKIILIKTSKDIHAYNLSPDSWKNSVGSRYVEL
ncbi:polymorphic toxin-type HINT domain-containing protein [Kitasatospora sp. NPDC093679]|uniref:polymorphic toxin-type HINT domain-containing protein n=1 Tax=Kitasatospora sp. NPDC093679 TaxID=3154983 RepID=UPI0034127F97